MAVEKMKMMNIVAPMEDMHRVLREVVLLNRVHIKNAVKEIHDSNFTLTVLEEHLDTIVDMGSIKKYESNKKQLGQQKAELEEMAKILDVDLVINDFYDDQATFVHCQDEIGALRQIVFPLQDQLEENQKKQLAYQDFLHSIAYVIDLDFDVSKLADMKNFNYHIGTLTKDSRLKLRNNYENISAIVLHIGSSVDGESYLFFTPKDMEKETQRILKSLNFKEISLPTEFAGTPREVSDKINEELTKLKELEYTIRSQISSYKEKFENKIDELYTYLVLEEKIESLADEVAVTKNFFYFSGWIPEKDQHSIRESFEKISDQIIILFNDDSDVSSEITPPTKLLNNWLMRPFELLVRMYGIPSYKEIDPTAFLGITYLLFFGAMFGDVGQGAIFFLGGFLLKKLSKNKIFGELMMRIALSSIFFGFLYGSVFGSEELIPALLVRPINNINFVLYASIMIGVIMLLISFGISIRNLIHRKDYEMAILGRNGIVGLLFYMILLIIFVQLVLQRTFIPLPILLILGAGMLLAMWFKKPLAHLIFHKPLDYEDGFGSYLLEGGFDLAETLLSFLSNTLSFIRLGAFALNHVGLFLAFSTMARLADSPVFGFIILVIGNIIIIGLEGLIVFIQGLRLEYYEMFSKYYEGNGIDYSPLSLKMKMED